MRLFGRKNKLVELHLQGKRVAILCVLDEEDHQDVTIVVPVLMTSCHVSLKPNIGPSAAHTTMIETAAMNVAGCPDA